MQAEDYTFVTLDSDDTLMSDAVVVDVDDDVDLLGAVTIDDDAADFITIDDDSLLSSDVDMLDVQTLDIDIEGSDISFIV